MNNPSAHPSYSHYYLLSPSTLFFVFFFCTSYCFFAHLVVFLHISLSFAHLIVFCTIIVFCTSYCFALFYFIAHFILISPFLTICMPLCYVTYIICILIVLHCHWADLIRLHFTSSYALYNYYVTNKETLNLEPWSLLCLFHSCSHDSWCRWEFRGDCRSGLPCCSSLWSWGDPTSHYHLAKGQPAYCVQSSAHVHTGWTVFACGCCPGWGCRHLHLPSI